MYNGSNELTNLGTTVQVVKPMCYTLESQDSMLALLTHGQ